MTHAGKAEAPGLGEGPLRPSGDAPFWQPGEHIWWVYRRPGWRLGDSQTVHPMTVVRDDADGLVAWLAGDTPVLWPRLRDRESVDPAQVRVMFDAPRIQARARWSGYGTLRIAPTGKPWLVWVFWWPDGRHKDFYVNLEEPHRRDDRSVVTGDRVLDVVVDHGEYGLAHARPGARALGPDEWTHWRKDTDELAEAVRRGRYTAEQAAEFERTAADVEAVVDGWGSPFCDGWEHWRPDPAWPVPALPGHVAFDLDLA